MKVFWRYSQWCILQLYALCKSLFSEKSFLDFDAIKIPSREYVHCIIAKKKEVFKEISVLIKMINTEPLFS